VNYAQRIETLTKELPADILISESTYEQVKTRVSTQEFEPIIIKGKKAPIRVYGVLELA
jgi:class 3 adenylate cyclase